MRPADTLTPWKKTIKAEKRAHERPVGVNHTPYDGRKSMTPKVILNGVLVES